jgi:hypothetical protein
MTVELDFAPRSSRRTHMSTLTVLATAWQRK